MKHLLILFLIPSLMICQNKDNQRPFNYNDDFNSGAFGRKWRKDITKNNSYKIDTISKQGRFEDGFLIAEMNPTGKYGTAKRSEYGIKLFDSIGHVKYLSFSFQLPETFKYDDRNLGRETMICQWHSKPAPGKDWDFYKEFLKYNRPSIALYITTNNNEDFYFILRYGNNGKKEFDKYGHIWSVIAVSEINVNEWYDFTFEIKWSDKNEGYIAAWLNGEPFTKFNGLHNKVYGANMHNISPVTFKFGQYRYFDDTNKHELYFDELKVGDNYKDVSITPIKDDYIQLMNQRRFIKNHK